MTLVPVTKENQVESTMFYHGILKDSIGGFQRFRRNGKTRVWKSRPTEFRIPIKRGLYQYGFIDHTNCNNFYVEVSE